MEEYRVKYGVSASALVEKAFSRLSVPFLYIYPPHTLHPISSTSPAQLQQFQESFPASDAQAPF
jgi:hypothetical protein